MRFPRILLVCFCVILMLILTGGCAPQEKADKPKIPEIAISEAIDILKDYTAVRDAAIDFPDDRSIHLVVLVRIGTTANTAREMGDNFARLLSSQAAIYSKDFEGPTADRLGSLYDHYQMSVTVGTGPENIIAHGAAVGSRYIRW